MDRLASNLDELRRRAGTGEQKSMLAREFGISRETLYQYLKAALSP
jgi:predicted DNA binding protein